MNREKVISREYKLTLISEKFTGNELEVKKKAGIFWAALKTTVQPVIKTAEGNLDTISAKREIRFYDTKDFLLNEKKYIFRERKNLIEDEREVTLKFRHEDRYISQDRDMKPKISGKEKIKFEEDIKAPFLKLHSFSSSVEISNQRELKRVKDVIKIFPGLADNLIKYERDEAIQLVNGFSAKEIVFTGAKLKLSNNPDVYAECALIIWYDMQKQDMNPVVGEFSFRYGNKKEKYSRKTAQRAYDLFKVVQDEMKEWIDINGNTKTGFVYKPE